MSVIEWLPWSAAAFERARIEERPVLLALAATWCRCCHEMDRTSYADPVVVSTVNERFVPVRVDADRRPDVGERYSLGGLPTTVFLTPDGRILGGGTYVPRERMAAVLAQVAQAFASRRRELEAPGESCPPDVPQVAVAQPDDVLVAAVFSAFDDEFGGFGTEPKFPLTGPLELALQRYRVSSDPAMEHVLVTTLDAMGWGGLYDELDGGFFRYATTRDWQGPAEEKLLDVNAALLRVYVDAAELLGISRYRDRAAGVLRYAWNWLADVDGGGWWGSQRADREYYATRLPDARRARTPPPIDRVLYAGWNARMVSAVLHASRVLQDDDLAAFALKSLERVLLACYAPGGGVAHYYDGAAHVRGLLDDQIAMLGAVLDAYELTGNIVYEMMAEELGHYTVRTMWDEQQGGFLDRARDAAGDAVGLLSQPLKPFVTNCDAARVLHRLAVSSGERAFADRARETLASVRSAAPAHGPLAAHYLLAVQGLRDR